MFKKNIKTVAIGDSIMTFVNGRLFKVDKIEPSDKVKELVNELQYRNKK